MEAKIPGYVESRIEDFPPLATLWNQCQLSIEVGRYGSLAPSVPMNWMISKEPPRFKPWRECVKALDDTQLERFAEWRGYSDRFCVWLRDQGLIGLYDGKHFCLPIFAPRSAGMVVAEHVFTPESSNGKSFMTTGASGNIGPMMLGALPHARCVFVAESPWDMFAVADRTEFYRDDAVCFVASGGASNHKRLASLPWPNTEPQIFLLTQRDDKRGPDNKTANERWVANVRKLIPFGVYLVGPPKDFHDYNDWIRDGVGKAELINQFESLAAMVDPLPAPAEEEQRQEPEDGQMAETVYQPTGNTPIGFLKRGIQQTDILLGNGFLEVGSAVLLAGPSGIGKSSIAMQMGCCWACGQPAFYLAVPRVMRVLAIQNEDSVNDLVRQSALVNHLGLDPILIEKNFWIETLRGRVGRAAVKAIGELAEWWEADIILINPLSAYHSGDISQNKDNIASLYGELGALLDRKQFGIFGFHHKGKPPKNGKGKSEDVYHEVMYEVLGGSTLTNFHRGIITVSPIGNSEVFKFTLAKRFEESGWTMKTEMFKWDEDRSKRLWVPASFAEAAEAKRTGKTLDDLRKLIPLTGTIAKEVLENRAHEAGFIRREYRGLLAEALEDTTPDALRLYRWAIYNPNGQPNIAYGRFEQPDDETPAAIKAARKEKDQLQRKRTKSL
jgi:archaellum biogenesis ATPase FlaH